MWICPKCSEQHEDQFEFCWKCSGDEAQAAITNAPQLLSGPQRELRPFRDILVRAIFAFLIGFVLSMLFLNLGNAWLVALFFSETTLTAATIVSLAGGAILGLTVGVFFWVGFPYMPIKESARSHVQEINDSRQTGT
jgi:hypothetical protein